MRVLRSSQYPPPPQVGGPGGPPMTLVMRDSDVIDTLESIRARGIAEEYFVAFDIFTMPNGGIVEATAKAMERMTDETREREQNQAIMYYWLVGFLGAVAETGIVLSDKPAPLSVAEMQATYRQVIAHPDYKHQTLTGFAKDGTKVGVVDGEIE